MISRCRYGLAAIIVAISIFLANAAAWAGQEVALPEETVTGSRLATSLEDISAPTYVITSDDIERSGANKLSELLSTVPGVFSRSRSGRGQDEFVETRGLTTELLFLIDGIPCYKTSHVADASTVDLRSLPIDRIERIEIVKGAGSAVYGSMAAAGVINIIMKDPGDTEARILAETGTHDWKRYGFSAPFSLSGGDVSFWYSHREEGRSPLLRYSSKDGKIYENENLDYDEDAGGVDFRNGPWQISTTWGEYSSKWNYGADLQEQEDSYSRYSVSYRKDRTRFVLYRDDQDRDIIQNGVKTNVNDGDWGAEFARNDRWGNFDAAWGFSYRDEDMKYDLAAYSVHYDKSRYNLAPFMELTSPLGDLLLNFGTRYEVWDQDGADDYDRLIPKLSLSYEAANGNSWYLSAGKFFAMPSLYELSYFGMPVTEPNFGLKPEEGWSYELGVKNNLQENPWSLSVFYLTMDDKIEVKPDHSAYENVAEFRSWGVEARKSWQLSECWKAMLGAAWMRAEQRDNPSSSWYKGGNPRWNLDGTLAYGRGPWNGSVTVHYLGDRDDERTGIGEGSQGDVTTVDTMLEWKNGDHSLSLSAYNIFDEDYLLQDYTAWGTNTKYYGPERRIYLTWKYSF